MDRRFQWEQDPSEEPEARWRWHHWSNGQDVFLLTPKAVIKNILVDCDSRKRRCATWRNSKAGIGRRNRRTNRSERNTCK